MTDWRTVATILLLGTPVLKAQPGPAGKPAQTIKPKVECSQMAGRTIPASAIALPTKGASIKSAKMDPGTGSIPIPADFVPEHCYIEGSIKSVDPAAPDINFAIAIPVNWNQKAWHIAGNGNDGFIPLLTTLARGLQGSPVGASLPPHAPFPITQGYATYGDDSGHKGGGIPWLQRLSGAPLPPPGAESHLPGPLGPDPTAWMKNDEAFRNYGYEHIKKAHDAVTAIFQDMYGMTPRVTYYGGESQGGRSAAQAAVRYPQDYDGVVIAEPVFSIRRDLGRELRQKLQASSGAWIPPAKQDAFRLETLKLCDALDGLADGVINNYLGCNRRLDPKINPDPLKAIRCPGGADTGNHCLSDGQMASINAFHSETDLGFALSDGETTTAPVATSQEYPAGQQGTRWLELSEKAPDSKSLPVSFLIQRYGNREKYDLARYDVTEFKTELQAMAAIMDPTSDWSALLASKTKVILASNAADFQSHAPLQMRWYDAAVKRSGQAAVDRSVRFYVTPNASHAGIGFSATTGVAQPRYMDLVGVLQNWVENGVTPPDPIPQTLEEQTPPYKVLRSRPLCRYPKYPRYKGKGDPEKMESYSCAMPDLGASDTAASKR